MKILHVVYNSYPDVTGAAVRTGYLVETQARGGHEPVVLSSPFQPPADPAQAGGMEHWKGIPHYRCYDGSDPGRFMTAKPWWERAVKLAALAPFIHRIREVVRRERVEVIHAHNLFFCGLAAVAAGGRTPVVYEVRSLVEEGMEGVGPVLRGSLRRMEILTCRLATHVTVLCRGLAEDLVGRGLAKEKITLAGNGVDVGAHRPSPAGARSNRFVVGYAGTLLPYEGLDLLLAGIARLVPRHAGLRVLLVGDGPARAALQEQVRRLGLEGVVVFAGRVPHDEMARHYEAIDLFVLPRRRSRLTDLVTPLKPLEIMAHGKPLLAGDCGGHRELVEDGVNGVLFPAGDTGALTARIESMMLDPEGRERLGQQAREWVCRHRTWEVQCRPVVELYERLVAERARGVLLVAPAPGPVPTGGVETGVGMILRSGLARRYGIRVWDRRLGRRFLRFGAFVAWRRPGVLHIKSSCGVNFWESVVYAAMGRLLGRRVLLQLHSGEFGEWYERHGAAGRGLVRWGLGLASDILVLSEYWREVLARLAPGRPIGVVPNGVEIPEQVAVRSGEGVMRVLTLGTLGRHKGHFEILEAAERLRGCAVQFVLAGPDVTSGRGEGEQVRRRAGELGLNGQVTFPGAVGPERKWELLTEADVFLLASHAEGMPNAVLEAMAAALPVVATGVGAVPEMLPAGVLVPVGDPGALARVLLELAGDPERRLELGRRNRERVEARYGFGRVEEALDAWYGGSTEPRP